MTQPDTVYEPPQSITPQTATLRGIAGALMLFAWVTLIGGLIGGIVFVLHEDNEGHNDLVWVGVVIGTHAAVSFTALMSLSILCKVAARMRETQVTSAEYIHLTLAWLVSSRATVKQYDDGYRAAQEYVDSLPKVGVASTRHQDHLDSLRSYILDREREDDPMTAINDPSLAPPESWDPTEY